MMIDPPIDKLLEITGCKYALVCLASKRVRTLLEKKADMLEETGEHAVTYALREIFSGEIEAGLEE
ncbi:MAG: DNA-directed RNA polymerase subunit omega [Firmicutes bacterium]|nr:DNA-directed RNA polymerase subunit omega [Bacillota bacterium]